MQVAEYMGEGIPGLCYTEQVGHGHVLVGCLEEARGQDIYLEEGGVLRRVAKGPVQSRG